MKASIPLEILHKLLPIVCNTADRSGQVNPNLSNALLQLEDSGKLSLTASGGSVEVEGVVSVNDSKPFEAGKAAISAQKLLGICMSLPQSGDVDFCVEERGEAGREEAILSFGNSRFALGCAQVDEFPLMRHSRGEEADEQSEQSPSLRLMLTAGQLKDVLDKTSLFMARDDTRRYLEGMLWEIAEGQLNFVATDGHRLCVCSQESQAGGADESQVQVIVPGRGVDRLRDVLGFAQGDREVEIQASANLLSVSVAPFTVVTRLIDEKYPDYRQLIPKSNQKQLLVDSATFDAVLGRVEILANERFRSVRLKAASGKMSATAKNQSEEIAEDECPVEYQDEPIEIMFNIRYLRDVLKAFGEGGVRISISDPGASVLFELDKAKKQMAAEIRCVVMPMRL